MFHLNFVLEEENMWNSFFDNFLSYFFSPSSWKKKESNKQNVVVALLLLFATIDVA